MTKPFEIAELVDRRVLQAERDVARAERRVAKAEHQVVQAEQALAAAALVAKGALQQERERAGVLQAELDQLYASTSWRISHPVRVASRLLQALRQRRLPQPLPRPPEAAPPPLAALPLAPREQAILQRLQGRGPD